MVSRSSIKSTSWLDTSTSVIWWDSRIIFSRVNRMRCGMASHEVARFGVAPRASPQHQLAVSRQLGLHLFVHLLVGDACPPHLVLVLDQYLPHLIVEAV